MGDWYTIGLVLGLGLAIGVVAVGVLGASRAGLGGAVVLGAALGAATGFLVDDAAEVIAGAIGGALGALAAFVVVSGALRRGATRTGVAAYLSVVAVLVVLLALVPLVGYLLAVVLPALAMRLRGRQAARYAGLRTLAK